MASAVLNGISVNIPQWEGLGTKVSHASTLVVESSRQHRVTASDVGRDTLVMKAASQLGHSTHIQRHFWTTHIWTYLGPQPCPLNLFFSASNCLLLCVCVCVRACKLQHPPFSFPRPLHLFVCQCGPPATQLACQEIRIILPASAQPRRPPVTAPRSAPRWLVLSITIYLLLE